jgi:predicted peptidase
VQENGSAAADIGYVEHPPVSYAYDLKQTFPLIIYNNGWGSERVFGKPGDELSVYANTDMFQVIHEGQWDDTRPLVVLSPQRCSVQLVDVELNRIKYFVDFAVSTYKIDPTRIYMVGMSAGAYYTWEYIRLNPTQLAAVVPISCGGSTVAADVMKQTPAWAFHAKADPIVSYTASLATVETI